MRKRKRLFTHVKHRSKLSAKESPVSDSQIEKEYLSPHSRLMDAIKDAVEGHGETDDSSEYSDEDKEESVYSEEETKSEPPKQPYVLKLFDRSVDLSQFEDDSPLYPICRAWMLNQPKACYKELGRKKEIPKLHGGVKLPGPDGPEVSRVPELLPEQKASTKDNINLNYQKVGCPSLQYLLGENSKRWLRVRKAWLDQAAKAEARYSSTQKVLNQIHVT